MSGKPEKSHIIIYEHLNQKVLNTIAKPSMINFQPFVQSCDFVLLKIYQPNPVGTEVLAILD